MSGITVKYEYNEGFNGHKTEIFEYLSFLIIIIYYYYIFQKESKNNFYLIQTFCWFVYIIDNVFTFTFLKIEL